MKTKLISLSIILLLFAGKIRAQEIDTLALKTAYEAETIYLDGNSAKYIKNGKKKRVGDFGRKLAKEFYNSPEAMQELKTFKRKSAIGGTMMLGGGLSILATIAVPHIAIPVQTALMAGGLTVYFTGIHVAIRSQKHLHKSIWLYNRDALMRPQ